MISTKVIDYLNERIDLSGGGLTKAEIRNGSKPDWQTRLQDFDDKYIYQYIKIHDEIRFPWLIHGLRQQTEDPLIRAHLLGFKDLDDEKAFMKKAIAMQKKMAGGMAGDTE